MRAFGSRRKASRIRSAILLLAAAAAGACSAPPYYETAADFEHAISAMGVVGEHSESATAVLASRGFKCADDLGHAHVCQRQADNVLCGQRQAVTLLVRPDNGQVSGFRVQSDASARLPHWCL